MESKFKIGDKVRIIRLTTLNGHNLSDDGHFIGLITTIVRAFTIQSLQRWGYNLAILNHRFFTDEEFELVENTLQKLKKRYGIKV